jgi:ribonuclease G
MSKELVISSNRHETRVAMIEDDQLVEVFHQREQEYSLAGSIHKGRVTRVLPGMQSAFVDIGLDRDAFLYVSDFFEDNEEYDKVVTSVEEKVLKLDRTDPASTALTALPEPLTVARTEPEASDPLPATPASLLAPAGAPPVRENREARDGRDGRGRRGRRRRGGKGPGTGHGIPDSKFYSPHDEPAEREAAAPEPEPQVEAAPARVEFTAPARTPYTAPARFQNNDEFFVLPGESLAKHRHAGGEPEDAPAEESVTEQVLSQVEAQEVKIEEVAAAEETVEDAVAALAGEEPAAIEPEPVAAPVAEAPEAPAVEAEPAAAIGTAAVEVAPPVAAPAAETEEAEVEAAGEEASPAVPVEAGVPSAEAEAEAAVEAESAVESDSGISAGEVAEGEVAEDEAAAELVDNGEPDLAGEAAAPEEGDAEAHFVDDEGPEPARIPTSLTATLREQNARYPHRVSRRMRRKGGRSPMSGDPQREPRPQQEPQPEQQRSAARPEGARPEAAVRVEKSAAPSISDLLKEGQEIIVQIAKEPLGQKGARITSHIALPGRFLVYMPTVDHIGVSRKIPSDDERLRLKRILQSNRTGISGGYIVRTAGDGRTEEELRADMLFLYNMWLDMRAKAEKRPAPLLIHHDLNVVERVLRDQLTASFKSIWVDNEELYESVLRFVQRFQPTLVSRVKLYTRSAPIFDEFGITQELEKALRPKVWLKSGGYIVINQTEALVAIDINTGKYVGKSNRLEDTIVKTNTDAIKEIVRQIRLRDLGGIIVVDFIDMDERKNRQKVMQALEEAMRSDRAPYKILQFNDFGLVAITRKRVKQSLERTLCTPCPYCEGAGYVKSPQTLVGEILQEAHKIAKVVEGKDVMLRVNPEVARLLKSNQNTYLQELEEILARTVIIKSDPQLHQEKFDLA